MSISAPDHDPQTHLGCSVIVADDTEAFRRFLVRALEILGCTARGVDTAAGLLDAVRRSRPDVVLLDWHLDGGSSARVATSLQAAGIPVVVITGDPGSVDVPGVPVLGKPVHLNDLRAEIARATRVP